MAVVVQAETPPPRPGPALSAAGEAALGVCKDVLMTTAGNTVDAYSGKQLCAALGNHGEASTSTEAPPQSRLPERLQGVCGWLDEHCDLGAPQNEAAAKALNDTLGVQTGDDLFAVDDEMWDNEDLAIAVGDVLRIKAAVSTVLDKAKKEADDAKAELAEGLRARMVAAKEKKAEKRAEKADKKARKAAAADAAVAEAEEPPDGPDWQGDLLRQVAMGKENRKARKEVAAADAKTQDEGLVVWVYEGKRIESQGEQRAHVGAMLTDDVFGACELRGQRKGSLLLRVDGEERERTAGHVAWWLPPPGSEAEAPASEASEATSATNKPGPAVTISLETAPG